MTLYLTHSCIFKKADSIESAFLIVLKKFWKIIITSVVFLLLLLAVFYTSLHLLTLLSHHMQNKGSIAVMLSYFFILILPLMIYIGFFFLTLPIAIVKNLSLADTYKKSFIIGKSNAMKMVLAFLLLIILVCSVHPETIFFPIFNNLYLAYFTDMIYCFVVYPFLFSFLVCFLQKTEQKASDQA